MRENVPIFALLTPVGRGAVATIGIRGSAAVRLVGRNFTPTSGKSLTSGPVGRVMFGRFSVAGVHGEELVVGILGRDEVEVHCHGGVAAAEAIAAALIAGGAERITWQEWLRIQTTDSIVAAALVALSRATTERTAAILLDQYRGALRSELMAIDRLLSQEEIQAANQRMQILLQRGQLGRHLTQSWRVVLAGRPNAGKSSLINALLGYERAIVFEQPGTTRDVLTATTAMDGWPVELADTAGLRGPVDELEAAGVERAQNAIAAADLVLFVADTTAAFEDALYRQVAKTARRLLIAHNKSDLATPPDDGRLPGKVVSAKTGTGIDALCTAIAESLVPRPPPPQAAVPFTPDVVAALATAQAHLDVGNGAAAQKSLASLLQM